MLGASPLTRASARAFSRSSAASRSERCAGPASPLSAPAQRGSRHHRLGRIPRRESRVLTQIRDRRNPESLADRGGAPSGLQRLRGRRPGIGRSVPRREALGLHPVRAHHGRAGVGLLGADGRVRGRVRPAPARRGDSLRIRGRHLSCRPPCRHERQVLPSGDQDGYSASTSVTGRFRVPSGCITYSCTFEL
jgi:hypothetical protein